MGDAGLQDPEAEAAAVAVTAVPAALVAPRTDAEVAALAGGEAYPVLSPDDAPEALRLVAESLRAALAAAPDLAGAQDASSLPACQLRLVRVHLSCWTPGAASCTRQREVPAVTIHRDSATLRAIPVESWDQWRAANALLHLPAMHLGHGSSLCHLLIVSSSHSR